MQVGGIWYLKGFDGFGGGEWCVVMGQCKQWYGVLYCQLCVLDQCFVVYVFFGEIVVGGIYVQRQGVGLEEVE